MRIGETFELGGKTYRAEEGDVCTGCAFRPKQGGCTHDGPQDCSGLHFVALAARPAPDYAPILAGILAGKQIQHLATDAWHDRHVTEAYSSMAALVPAAWLRVKPDTITVNGVELCAPTEVSREAASATTLPVVLIGYGDNCAATASRHFTCATEADAEALFNALVAPLPKAPAP